MDIFGTAIGMLKTPTWRVATFGCSLGVLAGLLVVVFESDFPDLRGEICEYNQTTEHEDCTAYSLFPFLLIQVFQILNDYGVAVTALATLVIAGFTGTLWKATSKQARLTREAIELGTKEFISTHRPRLIVRNIVVRHPGNSDPLFTGGQTLEGQFYVSNVGGTPATITEALVIVFQTTSGLSMRQPYEGSNGNLPVPTHKLAPGQSVPFPFCSDEVIGEGAATIGTKVIQKLQLFIMGWIEYRDDIGIIRRTAFCREFNRGTWERGRFHCVKNRDYEHEE